MDEGGETFGNFNLKIFLTSLATEKYYNQNFLVRWTLMENFREQFIRGFSGKCGGRKRE